MAAGGIWRYDTCIVVTPDSCLFDDASTLCGNITDTRCQAEILAAAARVLPSVDTPFARGLAAGNGVKTAAPERKASATGIGG